MAPDPAIVEAMAAALHRVNALQATSLGISLETPIRRLGDLASPLGNLFAAALRDAVPGADVGVVNNAARGLWADLADGPLTFGRLYDVFPFDNRVARVTLSGADLRRWVAGELRQGRRGMLGMSGVAVRASCPAGTVHVDLIRESGLPVQDNDRLLAVTIGAPTLSGSLASSAPLGGVGPTDNAPVVREVVEDWLRRLAHLTPGHLDAVIRSHADDGDRQAADCVVP